MRHDPHLANDLIIRSLQAKLAKLEARVRALEGQARRRRQARASSKPPTPEEAEKAAPILDRAARMYGCTVEQICGARGPRRLILPRAQAAHDCLVAGLSSVATGRVLGGRDHTTILNLRDRFQDLLEGAQR